MTCLHGQRGTTLLELLASTALVSILAAMAYGFTRAALMSARVLDVKAEAQEATIVALDVLARELRMAGYSASGTAITAVRVAAAEQIEVVADLNGDGDLDDSSERIAYSYSSEKRQLQRATGGGSPQPMVRDVPPEGVRFRYFDTGGSELGAAALLADDARQRIRRVDVRLRVEAVHPDPRVVGTLSSDVALSIYLRNP